MRKRLIVVSIAILLALSFLTILPSVGAEPDWWNTDWSYKKKITIDHTKVASDLTNFPMLIHVTDTDFIGHARSDGYDFVFVDSTESIEYYWELESYNSGTGELIAWVNITELDGDADQDLYCYYGNPDANTNPSSTSTWDSNYLGVYHMDDLTTSLIDDSTSNNNIGTKTGANNPIETATLVKIGKAQDFSTDNIFSTVDLSSYDESFTIEAWGRVETTDEVHLTNINPVWVVFNANEVGFKSGATPYTETQPSYTINTWNYWVFIGNSIGHFIYKDGGLGSEPDNTDTAIIDATTLLIGSYISAGYEWDGQLDEVRFSRIARSDSWITTTYNSQNSPSTFMTFGSELEQAPNNPPNKPINPTPTNTATNISIYTTLKIHVIDINDDTMSVSFYWSDDTLIETVTNIQNDTDAETSSLSLNRFIEYNWYAIANDSLLENTSDTFSFTTTANSPDKPLCVSPTDNQENVSLDTTLKVHVIDITGDNMTVSFYWGDDSLIETINDVQNDTDAETSSLSLDYETIYSWYATANDSITEIQSDTFIFTTIPNTPPIFKTGWIELADMLGSEEHITSLAVYNNNLYGGTGYSAKLYKWNDIVSWIEVAGQVEEDMVIYSLAVYNNALYGGSYPNGKLYKWNDVDSWIEVAGQLGSEGIKSLAVYNNNLYGGTYAYGYLYRWNDVDSWIEVADGFLDKLSSLIVYNNALYGGSDFDGKLYKWNDVDAWIEVAGGFGAERIKSLTVYNGSLYGGTFPNGKLYKWNDIDSWIEVAGMFGSEDEIKSLAVYNNSLYGGTADLGKLYKWNDVDTWIEVAGQVGVESINSLAVYNDNLYGGTSDDGSLLKFSQDVFPNKQNIGLSTIFKIKVIDIDNDNMSVSFYWDDDTLIETIIDVTNNTYAETSTLSFEYDTTYSWYAIANDSYSETISNIFSFTTMSMPNFPPVKPTCISPLNNSTDISITTTLKVHVTDINNDNMNVSFYFIEGEPSYVFYDDDDMQTTLDYPLAIRLSPTELTEYDGEYLTGVMIHDTGVIAESFTIEIYADGNEINPLVITTSQNIAYTDGSGWNEIILDNPVLINDTHHIWVVIDSISLGLDSGCTEAGKSDLINMGMGWQSLLNDYGYDYDNMIRVRIGGLITPIITIPNVTNDTDAETSSLSLDINTCYNWYAIADDSLLKTQSDTFIFTTGETTTPVCEHAIPRALSDGYLYMIYRNGNINVSNLNLLMGSYSPFTVCKFNYTSSDWDCEVITIKTNDYIRVKINPSDMPYSDTLIPITPQIRFKITDADEDDELTIIVKSNSSGSWEVVKEWSNVSEGWFTCEDNNMDEYNTTYYYSINVTDSYDNNLIIVSSFITTSTEPSIPLITPSIDIYIYGITGIVILLGGMYILSKKKRKR